MTGSSDGTVKLWDVRDLSQPTETIIMDIKNTDIASKGDMENALGVSCLEYEGTIPTKFMVGTEQGKIISCSKKAKSQLESVLKVFKKQKNYAL